MSSALPLVPWLGVTVLRRRGRTFIAGAAVSGLAVRAGLNVIAPDAFVARFNSARAEHARGAAGTEPDLVHMSQLSGEAAGMATRSVLTGPAGMVARRALRNGNGSGAMLRSLSSGAGVRHCRPRYEARGTAPGDSGTSVLCAERGRWKS